MTAPDTSRAAPRQQFATTHWSLVLEAAEESHPQSGQALATLCETYWYPLYAYVRRQGYKTADAQDLTQGFFARLLEKRDLKDVDQQKGRFRSFLLASLKHFLINEWDKAHAAKRGGKKSTLSLDFDSAESRFVMEPAHQQTAEAFFDRQWALTLLDQVHTHLEDEQRQAGRIPQFEQLQIYLTGDAEAPTYRAVGERIGLKEGAVKVAVHRLRVRFRELLREQIGQTVAEEEEIDDEIRALMGALRC